MINSARISRLLVLVLLHILFAGYVSAQKRLFIPRNSQESFFQGYWAYENQDEIFIVKIKPLRADPGNTYYNPGVYKVVGSYLYKKGDTLVSDNLSYEQEPIYGVLEQFASFTQISGGFYDRVKQRYKGMLSICAISSAPGREQLFWRVSLSDAFLEDLTDEEYEKWKDPFSVPSAVFLTKVNDLGKYSSKGIFLEPFPEKKHSPLDLDFSLPGKFPVDMAKFNRLWEKSPAPESAPFSLCLDSLVDYGQVKRNFYKDSKITYCQYAFKSNKAGLYGALLIDHHNYRDSLVKIKCFYLEVSDSTGNHISEYVASMIPTKAFSERNPDYDFLSKANFSGIILYSSKEGELMSVETLMNGMIFGSGLLDRDKDTPSEYPAAKSKSFTDYCVVCMRQRATVTGFCPDCEASFLKSLVIAGGNSQGVFEEMWATVIHQRGF